MTIAALIVGFALLLYGTAVVAADQRNRAIAAAMRAATAQAAPQEPKNEYCPCREGPWADAIQTWTYEPDHQNLSKAEH
jgi:hypothetical protein